MMQHTNYFFTLFGFVAWSAAIWVFALVAGRYIPMLKHWSRWWQGLILASLCSLLPALPTAAVSVLPEALFQPLFRMASIASLEQTTAQNLAASGYHWRLIPFLVYFVIAMVGAIKIVSFFACFRQFSHNINSSMIHHKRRLGLSSNLHPVLNKKLSEGLKKTLQDKKIPLKVCNTALPPFVFGLKNPSIIVPEKLLNLPEMQLEIIVQHELTHIQRYDPAALLIIRFIRCVFWFNPFLYFIEKRFLVSMELNCDSQTLAQHSRHITNYAYHYASALLSCIKIFNKPKPLPPHYFIAHFTGDPMSLKKRITNLTGTKPLGALSPLGKVTTGFTIVLLAALPLSVNSDLPQSKQLQKNTGVKPVSDARLSSRFGAVNKIRNDKPHKGIDLAADIGSPVLASFTGTVVVADDQTLHANYGKTVILQHSDSEQSVYAHLDQILVSKGQKIRAGEPLGTVGNTGQATGPHLHFEIRQEGKAVNPQLYLR